MAKAIKTPLKVAKQEVTPETVTATVPEEVPGKTVLSFTAPTPLWATWIFRTEFIMNKALGMYLAGTQRIPQDKVLEMVLILNIVDFVVWFIGRSIGVKKEDIAKDAG